MTSRGTSGFFPRVGASIAPATDILLFPAFDGHDTTSLRSRTFPSGLAAERRARCGKYPSRRFPDAGRLFRSHVEACVISQTADTVYALSCRVVWVSFPDESYDSTKDSDAK